MNESSLWAMILSLLIVCFTLGGISNCSNNRRVKLACIENTGNPYCEVKKLR